MAGKNESKVAAPVGGHTELLPCPFCGSQKLDMFGIGEYIACQGCQTFGPSAKYRRGESEAARAERARYLWNARATGAAS